MSGTKKSGTTSPPDSNKHKMNFRDLYKIPKNTHLMRIFMKGEGLSKDNFQYFSLVLIALFNIAFSFMGYFLAIQIFAPNPTSFFISYLAIGAVLFVFSLTSTGGYIAGCRRDARRPERDIPTRPHYVDIIMPVGFFFVLWLLNSGAFANYITKAGGLGNAAVPSVYSDVLGTLKETQTEVSLGLLWNSCGQILATTSMILVVITASGMHAHLHPEIEIEKS